LVKGKDGTIIYREWLPAASAVALYGDFNQWNDGSHRLERKEYGVWELTLPAGSIPHKSRSGLNSVINLAHLGIPTPNGVLELFRT
jgi:1,4-alpha-glucan branching enzyme